MARHFAQAALAVQTIQAGVGDKHVVRNGETLVEGFKHIRKHHVIRIHEGDEAALRGFDGPLPGLADAAVWAVKDLDAPVPAGIFLADAEAAVGAAVVHQYDFQPHPGLGEHAFEALAQPAFGIVHRYYYGYKSFIHRQSAISLSGAADALSVPGPPCRLLSYCIRRRVRRRPARRAGSGRPPRSRRWCGRQGRRGRFRRPWL